MRVISGLISAVDCPRPDSIPKSRPRGRKAAGLRYERELAKALPKALHGQWFRFEDRIGRGHCQTDLLLETYWGWCVLEAKYTWTEAGHRQIDQLYRPVVERAMKRPTFGLVVCKVLTREVKPEWICSNLNSAVARASAGYKTVLHWIGAGLGPLQLPGPLSHLATDMASL